MLSICVLENLRSPDAALIDDVTGFLKRGDRSPWVKRQCAGTAGRIGNSDYDVFLCHTSARDAAMADRELYFPVESTASFWPDCHQLK